MGRISRSAHVDAAIGPVADAAGRPLARPPRWSAQFKAWESAAYKYAGSPVDLIEYCAAIGGCDDPLPQAGPSAPAGGRPAAAAVPAAPVIVVDPETVAREAVASMKIPAGPVETGPDPAANEWKMAAVGYPLWLWTEDPDERRVTVTEQGITVSLVGRRVSTSFDMGDGTVKQCGTTTPYHPGVTPGTDSPTCSHRYQRPSLPGGTYAVRATSHWQVRWSALGQTGVIPVSRTGPAVQIPVGELHALRLPDAPRG